MMLSYRKNFCMTAPMSERSGIGADFFLSGFILSFALKALVPDLPLLFPPAIDLR